MTLSISALVTNYNTWELTTKSIEKLQQYGKDALRQVLVMDDASVQSPTGVFTPQVKVIYNQENQGLIVTVNRGFSYLREDIILLFDSDAYPLNDYTEIIIKKFTENPRLAALGFQTFDEKGNTTASWQRAPDAMGLLLGQKLEAIYQHRFKSNQTQPILLYQCAVAIRRQAFEDVGGFDENFDWLDADLDFSLKLHSKGWDVEVEPELRAFHQGGGTFQATSARVLRHHQNRWRLLRKHSLISHPRLLKLGLAIRHWLEYVTLKVAGKLIFPDEKIREDKVRSRQKLISTVWQDYSNC